MNQPKFNFGETVKTSCGKVFIISDIRRDAESDYIYNEDRSSGPHFPEADLEIYVSKRIIDDDKKLDGEEMLPREPILQFFSVEHLPVSLRIVSAPFAKLAEDIVKNLPRNPERTTALRKLLEAKDCAVRAILFKEEISDG